MTRLRSRKRDLARRVARFRCANDISQLEDLRSHIAALNIMEYQNYIQRTAEKLRSDPKEFWKFVDEKRNRKSSPHTTTLDGLQAQTPTGVADLFGAFFGSVYAARSDQSFDFETHRISTDQISSEVSEEKVRKLMKDLGVSKGAGPDGLPPQFYKSTITATTKSLTLIFRPSLSCHQFPELWKHAVVTPVFKSGDRSDFRNCRPISILSCPAKLLDPLMSIFLSTVFKGILSESRHAYRKGSSATTNSLQYTSHILSQLEMGSQVDGLYMDIS